MKRVLLALIVACHIEDLSKVFPEDRCVLDGNYLAEMIPMTDECGEPTVYAWTPEPGPMTECIGIFIREDKIISMICKEGQPSLNCYAATLVDDCPYSVIIHREPDEP